jgi:hypothetical protein
MDRLSNTDNGGDIVGISKNIKYVELDDSDIVLLSTYRFLKSRKETIYLYFYRHLLLNATNDLFLMSMREIMRCKISLHLYRHHLLVYKVNEK